MYKLRFGNKLLLKALVKPLLEVIYRSARLTAASCW